jgi:hypothetical protein
VATTPTLRPLGVGEILDAGIKLYVRHWKPLMLCVAGIALPVQILAVLVMASIDSSSLDTFRSGAAPSSGDEINWAEAAAFIGIAIATGLGTLLATAACFKAVSDAWLGARPEAGRSLRFGVRRLPALIWLSIVMGAGLVLAFFALVLPSIWLFVSWSLAVPALLFERVGAFTAIRRSFALVRGRWWPTFGALLVGYLLASIVAGIVQLVPEGIASAVASDSVVADAIAAVVGGTVSAMIATPYTAAILTLLYFDQRVRKEGFDLQRLADGLGTPPPGWVAPDAPPPADERRWWQDAEPALAPGESATYGGGFARPQPPEPSLPPESPPSSESPPAGAARRDRKRADWLPPEAPRGSGGL